jgi:hypothetical protein
MAIFLKRNGKTYEINDADQERIRELTVQNGGNIEMAIALHFEEKFGESLGVPPSIFKGECGGTYSGREIALQQFQRWKQHDIAETEEGA